MGFAYQWWIDYDGEYPEAVLDSMAGALGRAGVAASDVVHLSGDEVSAAASGPDGGLAWAAIQARRYLIVGVGGDEAGGGDLAGTSGRPAPPALAAGATGLLEVAPLELWVLCAAPAPDAEPANFGLGRYPAMVRHHGSGGAAQVTPTGVGDGWHWCSSCKPGLLSERVGLVIAATLDAARDAGASTRLYAG